MAPSPSGPAGGTARPEGTAPAPGPTGGGPGRAPAVARLRSPLPPGFYTVVLADGGHRTLLVRPAGPEFRRGVLVLGYLAGPDNERDYVGFAHVTRTGAVHLWKRFRRESHLVGSVKALVDDPGAAARAFTLRSGRCQACGHVLTHPGSIARGYGPVCGSALVVDDERSGQDSGEPGTSG